MKDQIMIVNGKEYPLWSQFVERQAEFIGGDLEDFGDSLDRRFGHGVARTIITGITLEPNGEDSAFFSVNGEGFGCGFDVRHGGVSCGDIGWVTIRGYGGHKWRFRMAKKAVEEA